MKHKIWLIILSLAVLILFAVLYFSSSNPKVGSWLQVIAPIVIAILFVWNLLKKNEPPG